MRSIEIRDRPVITLENVPITQGSVLPRTEGDMSGGRVAKDVYSEIKNPTVGPAVIEGVLSNQGYDVTTLDQRFNRHYGEFSKADWERLASSDIVGVTSMTRGTDVSLRFIEEVRKINPRVIIIAGGYGPTFQPNEWLAPEKGADFVVRGEGEKTIVELIKTLKDGSSVENILGISHKIGGEIRRNGDRPLLTEHELSELPIPHFPDYIKENSQAHTIMTRRGCPYGCTYCQVTQFHQGKTRAEGNPRVIAQIKNSKSGKEVFIVDDNFAPYTKINEVNQTIQMIIDEGLNNRHYWLQLDTVTVNRVPGFAKRLRRMGVFGVCLGIESVTPQVLKAMHKAATAEQNQKAIKEFQKNGIFTFAMTILGSKGENPESIRQLHEFLVGSVVNAIQICPLTPLPETEVGREKKLFPHVQRDRSLVDGSHVVSLPPPDFTAYTLQKIQQAIYKDFYSPRHVRNILKPLEHLLSDPKRSLQLAAMNILVRFYASKLMRSIYESPYGKSHEEKLKQIDARVAQEISELKEQEAIDGMLESTGIPNKGIIFDGTQILK